MPQIKRRINADVNNTPADDPKLRKKRSKIQHEHDNIRSLFSNADSKDISHALVRTFLQLLKSSLFMHQSRLTEIYEVIMEPRAEEDRLKSVCQIFNILNRPPAVQGFLSELILLFLTPEEAMEFSCFEVYRGRMQALDILVKLQQYQQITKGKQASKLLFKSVLDATDTADGNAIFENVSSSFSSDPNLRDFIMPLFPDQPFDVNLVATADMETITDDHVQCQDPDEFEVVNWADNYSSDVSLSRQCNCQCHQELASATNLGHCGLCSIKFSGDQVLLWRGNRLVRAQIEFAKYDVPYSQDNEEESACAMSPTKIISSMANADDSAEWNEVFQALDSMETDDDQPPTATAEESGLFSTPPTSPRKYWSTTGSRNVGVPPRFASRSPRKFGPNDDSNQDVLKRAILETFGRNLWAKGISPVKRGSHFGIGGPNDESNSTSNVFMRGSDGANTMLAAAAIDSNLEATTSCSGFYFHTLRKPAENKTSTFESSNVEAATTSEAVPLEEAASSAPEESKEDGGGDIDADVEESFTEEDDRYLLEQFKIHGNVYEAGAAAMEKLRKSRHKVRDRLKLLLELLRDTE